MAEEVKEEYTPIPVGSTYKRTVVAEDNTPKSIKVLSVLVILMGLLAIGCSTAMLMDIL